MGDEPASEGLAHHPVSRRVEMPVHPEERAGPALLSAAEGGEGLDVQEPGPLEPGGELALGAVQVIAISREPELFPPALPSLGIHLDCRRDGQDDEPGAQLARLGRASATNRSVTSR